jgi:hypothetical protein
MSTGISRRTTCFPRRSGSRDQAPEVGQRKFRPPADGVADKRAGICQNSQGGSDSAPGCRSGYARPGVGAYAQAIARDRWRLYKVEERLRQVNIGGTAVGTGLNAPRKFVFTMIDELRDVTGLALARADYLMDATQNNDVFVEASGLLKTSAVNLAKSPVTFVSFFGAPRGLAEIHLPPSRPFLDMAGKVNPVLPEAVNQVAFQVMANDLAITLALSPSLESTLSAPDRPQLLESLDMLDHVLLSLLSAHRWDHGRRRPLRAWLEHPPRR